jgi:hypothetical protein
MVQNRNNSHIQSKTTNELIVSDVEKHTESDAEMVPACESMEMPFANKRVDSIPKRLAEVIAKGADHIAD